MRCPSGGDCFALECRLAGSCQGYDVEIEAVTVIHTSIRRRAAAEASLTVASPAPVKRRLGQPEEP